MLKKHWLSPVTISEDKLEYIFILKDNVYFHDSPCFENGKGRKLNSDDVKYTFERLARRINNFPNWQLLNNKIVGINEYHNAEIDYIAGIKSHK